MYSNDNCNVFLLLIWLIALISCIMPSSTQGYTNSPVRLQIRERQIKTSVDYIID